MGTVAKVHSCLDLTVRSTHNSAQNGETCVWWRYMRDELKTRHLQSKLFESLVAKTSTWRTGDLSRKLEFGVDEATIYPQMATNNALAANTITNAKKSQDSGRSSHFKFGTCTATWKWTPSNSGCSPYNSAFIGYCGQEEPPFLNDTCSRRALKLGEGRKHILNRESATKGFPEFLAAGTVCWDGQERGKVWQSKVADTNCEAQTKHLKILSFRFFKLKNLAIESFGCLPTNRKALQLVVRTFVIEITPSPTASSIQGRHFLQYPRPGIRFIDTKARDSIFASFLVKTPSSF